jgi:cytochrome c-type biogenesis protein
MFEFLQSIADNSQFPLLTAFVLGIMTAISPCPLATNISAIGFISKDIDNRKRIFWNGILYALGRTISYTLLAIILISILKQGASIYKIQKYISTYGEMFIGPLLIIIGFFMLDIIKLNFSLTHHITKNSENKKPRGWGALWLGIILALAFCPYSGILYFGGLIPLALSTKTGFILPIIFAFATALPVIIFAWVLAFALSSVGNIYHHIKNFEFWFRRIVAGVFIIIGLYYCWIVYI